MFRAMQRSRNYIHIMFCCGLAVFYLYDYLLRVFPSTVISGLNETYHFSSLSYGFLLTSYYFFYIPLQLIVGVLVDRYRLFNLMIVALLFSIAGCCLFANAHTYLIAEFGRIIMGIGASFIFVCILKTISLRLNMSKFTYYLGIVICVGMLGGLLMDMGLVFIVNNYGWRLACYLLAFFGLFLITVNIFNLQKQKYYLPIKKISFSADVVLLKKIMCNRRLWIQCLIGALLYLPIAGFAESWGVSFLNNTNQVSVLAASLDISMMFLGFAVGAPLFGWFNDRFAQHQLTLTTGTVGSTILLSVVLYVPALTTVRLGIFLFLLGFFSSSLVVIFALNCKLVDRSCLGKIFGITNFVMMLAGYSAWLIGSLINSVTAKIVSEFFSFYSVSNYQVAFLILPLGSLLAVFLTFFVRDDVTVATSQLL